MKKTGIKRALSMVLALVMMVSLLPAIELTADAATVAPIVIDFTKATIDGKTAGAVAVSKISGEMKNGLVEEEFDSPFGDN